jgi:hypothetical protein
MIDDAPSNGAAGIRRPALCGGLLRLRSSRMPQLITIAQQRVMHF